jgi:hypothetical protein
MSLSLSKTGKTYTAYISLHGNLVWQESHPSRESATLAMWEAALFIRDIATATERSVEAMIYDAMSKRA